MSRFNPFPSFLFFLSSPRVSFSLYLSLSIYNILVHLEIGGHETSKIFLRARRLDEQAIPLRGIILTRHASTRQCVRSEFRSLSANQPLHLLLSSLAALYCPALDTARYFLALIAENVVVRLWPLIVNYSTRGVARLRSQKEWKRGLLSVSVYCWDFCSLTDRNRGCNQVISSYVTPVE